MDLQLNKTYNGFKFLEIKHIKEINSDARIFYHEKSGAKLFFLKNEDNNKVFSISFRTPPKDSTGVAHILEHSVLCGSRKFPVKEPFVELIKGSMNTFLNAFTFADKTMYPVASTNDKDFVNLMDVYLDAAFYPNIYKYPEIMMQEGWHYELENKEGELTYKGVVYNEMKGAFSSPESILFRKISESLYPDTEYGVESGGDPDSIIDLTQEEFIDFHKRYYHPSNSYIYLYGDMDILDKLKFLDENYLKDFDKLEVNSKLSMQRTFDKQKETIIKYPISSNEKEDDKTFFSMNFSVGKSENAELCLAFEILEYLLLETPSSPLKKSLIDSEIGKDVFGVFEASMLQPMFSIVVKNSNENQKEQFKEIVFNTLKDLVKNGIDKKLIEASINMKEFRLREADYHGYPKGLIYSMKVMDSWLYDEMPWLYLEYDNMLNNIKSALTSNYFEEIIEKYILNNKHSSILILKPEKGLAEKKEELIKTKLKQYKESLSEKEIEKIIETTIKLKERQSTPDTLEDLKKIPLLSIKDIERTAKELPLVKKQERDLEILHHAVFTNNIAYINMYFSTEGVSQELIPYISILSTVMGRVSTEKYDYEDIGKEVNIYTGGIRYSAEIYSRKSDCENFSPKFVVKSKALVENMNKQLELLGEIICHTKFDDYKRLKEIIQETKSRLEMMIFDRGHIVAGTHALSYFSSVGKYQDLLSGIEFYKFIVDLDKNFDKEKDNIANNLKTVAENIFNKNNLIISITIPDDEYKIFKENIDILYRKLKENVIEKKKYNFDLEAKNEGLMTSSKVQYVAKGYNFVKLGYKYSGSLQVLKTIINYNYLWNKVRVQGGAYGSFAVFQINGNMFFVSYRDPNLKQTLDVYSEAENFFKNFDTDEREMTKYIIGTVSDLDFPLTPSMKGEKACENYIKGITYTDIQNEREEIINTNIDTIRNFSGLIGSAMKKDCICVLGNEDIIKENKDIFNELVNLFE